MDWLIRYVKKKTIDFSDIFYKFNPPYSHGGVWGGGGAQKREILQ